MPTTDTTAAVQAAVDTATAATKLAAEFKRRLELTSKGPSAEAVKAAAERLVDYRWVQGVDVEKTAAALADPTTALTLLADIAQKAAEKIASLTGGQPGNPRLAAGTVVTTDKQASAGEPVDEAERLWQERMNSRRRQIG